MAVEVAPLGAVVMAVRGVLARVETGIVKAMAAMAAMAEAAAEVAVAVRAVAVHQSDCGALAWPQFVLKTARQLQPDQAVTRAAPATVPTGPTVNVLICAMPNRSIEIATIPMLCNADTVFYQ